MSAEAADKAPSPSGKKKKKKPTGAAVAEPVAPPEAIDRLGARLPAPVEPVDDRPAFARSFPPDPELDRLVDVFEAGNYAEVRVRAKALVHATKSDDVRRAARVLLERLEPDPISKYMLLVAVALLGFLSFWYWTHPHGSP